MNINKSYFKFISEIKSIDEEKQIVSGVIGSDDSIDRHGDRINPKGWDLSNYKKSPVILLNHDYRSLAIGKAVKVKIEDNKLVFDIEFSKSYDVAVKAFNLVKEGIMKAWSVGFLVKEWARSGSDYTIEKAELLELSLVTVPANPNALTQDQLSLVDAFCKSLDDAEKKEEEQDNQPEATKEIDLEPLTNSIEELKAQVKTLEESIDTKIDSKLESLTKSTISETEGDEEHAEDPTLLALNALGQELKEQNQGAGKALKSLNTLLENLQPKE